ncbi:FCD domain-containing protein, partial [Cupriavidus basilensis]
VPRRGIYIMRKTKREIVEMIQVWAALESMAARLAYLACQRRGDRAVAPYVRRFRDATPAEHIEEYSDANIAFHQAIVQLSKVADHHGLDQEYLCPCARDTEDDDLAK